jgi:hypothetical protein
MRRAVLRPIPAQCVKRILSIQARNLDGTLDVSFGLLGYKVVMPPGNTETLQYRLTSMAVDAQIDGSIIVAGTLVDSNNKVNPVLMHFDP